MYTDSNENVFNYKVFNAEFRGFSLFTVKLIAALPSINHFLGIL